MLPPLLSKDVSICGLALSVKEIGNFCKGRMDRRYPRELCSEGFFFSALARFNDRDEYLLEKKPGFWFIIEIYFICNNKKVSRVRLISL